MKNKTVLILKNTPLAQAMKASIENEGTRDEKILDIIYTYVLWALNMNGVKEKVAVSHARVAAYCIYDELVIEAKKYVKQKANTKEAQKKDRKQGKG